MPNGTCRPRTAALSREPLALTALATLTLTALLGLAASTAWSMPAPAPGNTRGLPHSVREALKQNPDLFHPKKGFSTVVQRQKAERQKLVERLTRSGMSLGEAENEALSRITTVRYCPVLCGIYADKGSPDWPVADLVDELFSLDYGATNPLGQPGSMREHYRDMSYGTFDLQGGVFGWFAVPENGLYYYSDDKGLGTDRASGEAGAFIRHTLEAADPTIDFRTYDNDGPDNVPNSGDDDGVADLVMFVHPNDGGECGSDEIWSHSFSYSGWAQHGSAFVTNDIGYNGQPIKVDDYVIMPAISCFGGRIEIGVFSHEFGHALGLPDLYDRTAFDPANATVSSAGMGLYCLMAAGSYGGDYSHPATPTQMCAWSKEFLGWLTPHEIVCDETRAVYTTEGAADALKLWRGGDYSEHEWFLVENRQRKKWDRFLRGSGFLITHVDDNVTTQNDEPCPTGNPCPAGHYQVMVVEADNQWELQAPSATGSAPFFGEAGDFFSAENNADWDQLTTPSSRDHAAMSTGVSVHGITSSADKMFADFSVAQTCAATPSLGLVTSRVSGGCDLDGFLDAGETTSLAVTIRNLPTAGPATGVRGTLVSLSPQVSVVSDESAFPDLGRGKSGEAIVPFEIQGSAAAACSSSVSLRLDLTADGGYAASVMLDVPTGLDSLFVPFPTFLDDIESGSENGWHHYADVNDDDWAPNTNGNHTLFAVPGHSWFSAAPAAGKDVSLLPPAFVPSASTVVSFWHRYDTEDNWDGCVLELSLDGGATWIDVGDLTNVMYDDAVMVNPQSTISGRRCWNGLSNGYPAFEQVTLAMATWAGQTCLLRFRMATDLAATGTAVPGWNIDDYQVTNADILRERCESTTLCGGAETDPPVFAGLEQATNPNASACDAVDLKWQPASDASPPITYLVYASTLSPVSTAAPVASTGLLKHRVSGLTPGETYHFLVRARDAQGNVDGNMVERTVTLTCDAPDLVLKSTRLVELEGCDGDDRPDEGEVLSLAVTLKNESYTDARQVQGTLSTSSPHVLLRRPFATFPDLGSRHFEESPLPFEIAVKPGAGCMEPAVLELEVTAAGGYSVVRTITLMLESDQGFVSADFFDDIEGVEPNGFSHDAESGADDWAYTTSDAYSPTHSWFTSETPSVKSASLQSPPFYITANSVLSFRHKFNLEDPFDGAVLEISTDDGGTWEDIGPNYNSMQDPRGAVFSSPFAPGTPFWSGQSNGWELVTVNVGALTTPTGEPRFVDRTARFRWRIGCDDDINVPNGGWWIDDVSLTNSGSFTVSCNAAAPCRIVSVPEAPATPRVSELAPVRPNPLLARAVFEYRIASEDAGPVSLRIFDLAGRVVRTLVDGPREAGVHQVVWDRLDDDGRRIVGGVYFGQLRLATRTQARKLLVVR